MKKSIITLMILTSFNAVGITMPSAPSSPSAYDEIRTEEGSVCRSAIGGNLQIHGGLMGADGQYDNNYNTHYVGSENRDQNEFGAYIGFAYSFGGEKRIRCDRIAQIETERAEIKLQKLKAEIAALEKLRELQYLEAEGNLPKLSRVNN